MGGRWQVASCTCLSIVSFISLLCFLVHYTKEVLDQHRQSVGIVLEAVARTALSLYNSAINFQAGVQRLRSFFVTTFVVRVFKPGELCLIDVKVIEHRGNEVTWLVGMT